MRRKVSGGAQQQQEIPAAEPAPEPAPDERQQHPHHPKPWGGIITDVFRLDVAATYERLSRDLTLGDGATEYGPVLSALDQASRNAFDAARLVRAAKLADEKFSLELEERLEVMRTAAREQLDKEKADAKADGKAAKAPTLQEVSDRMLVSWPDEVRSISGRKAEMHGAFRSIEALERAWWDRCASLRVMAERFQRRV